MTQELFVSPVKLALYGPAGSGKDYVASSLTKYIYQERNDIFLDLKRFAFADKLKSIANTIIGLDDQGSLDIAISSEAFKNGYFIDLENFNTRWLLNFKEGDQNIPEQPYYEYNGRERSRKVYKDNYIYNETPWYVIYTADDLNELCSRGMSRSDNLVIPNISSFWEYESVIYPDGYNKDEDTFRRLISYREFIVWLGTYCFQNLLGKSSLVNIMFKDPIYKGWTTSNYHGVIITDVRFPHEYEACKREGYKFIKIVPEKKEADVNNIAEMHYSKFDYDFEFYNSRDKGHFKSEMDRLVQFIKDNFTEPFDPKKHIISINTKN